MNVSQKPEKSTQKANYVLVESVFSLNSDAFPNLTTHSSMNSPKNTANAYWRANLKLVGCLLIVWFVVSFGCGILFVEQLDQYRIGGFKLGFWFAQQGSIYVFVGLIFFYVWKMNKIDREYEVEE